MAILASSLDNFIILNNSHSVAQPYVTFTVGSPTNVTIKIKDKYNDDGYSKEIVGDASSVISSDSFNTGGLVALNLLECLKLNSIFFNVTLDSANTVKAFIDTSISYSITVSGNGITVGGTYSSYEAASPNKMVLMLNGVIDENTTSISLEKYNNNPTVSFNVTSPFRYASVKKPISVNIMAYQVWESKASLVTVPYSSAIIMPTTLSKFQEVDWTRFYGGNKVHFLTNNENRYYNYGEHYGLSVMCDGNLTIKKNYYTNSGVFLESQTIYEYMETNGIRKDIYDVLDLDSIEARYHHQVGYVDVYPVINGVDQYPVRFNIKPRCKGNNEVFFINELGGVDSFNFTNQRVIERTIEDQSTYFVNPIAPYQDVQELEYVKQKRNEVNVTLSTNQIDLSTAQWLNELNKSKYVYKYLGVGFPKYRIIIVSKFDITTDTSNDEFELELEYHDADNDIKI